MIYDFAVKVEAYFLQKDYITSDEIGLVSYGLFTIISRLMYGIISIAIGQLFNCFFESICFYISFLFVKKYAGGFHAKTEFRCFLLSSLSIVLSIIGIYYSKKIIIFELLILILAIVSCFFISIFAPIPSKERQLDETEIKRYSKITKLRIVILIIVCASFYLLSYNNICISICNSLILGSILLIAGKIKNYYTLRNEIQ